MSTSAEGIDVSAFQVDLTVQDLSGLDFVFTKATDGITETDPHFTHNWAAIKQARRHRGTYHELQAGLAGGQAAHFLSVVQGQGLEPGDMLAVVASDYPGVTDAEVLTFCDAVQAATGDHNPVLCYTDLSVGAGLWLTSAARFPLWVAWPSPTAPTMPLANWRRWELWQWGTRLVPGLGHVDANGWNGTPAEMATWIASFKPKPPPAPIPDPVPAQLGDDDMQLPAGPWKNAAGFYALTLMPPQKVDLPEGAEVSPSVLRLSCASPASFQLALGPAEPANWQTVTVDYKRSPVLINIDDPQSGMPYPVLKIKPTDPAGNPAPVSYDFD